MLFKSLDDSMGLISVDDFTSTEDSGVDFKSTAVLDSICLTSIEGSVGSALVVDLRSIEDSIDCISVDGLRSIADSMDSSLIVNLSSIELIVSIDLVSVVGF